MVITETKEEKKKAWKKKKLWNLPLYCCCQRDILDEHYASLHLTEGSSKSVFHTAPSQCQKETRTEMLRRFFVQIQVQGACVFPTARNINFSSSSRKGQWQGNRWWTPFMEEVLVQPLPGKKEACWALLAAVPRTSCTTKCSTLLFCTGPSFL